MDWDWAALGAALRARREALNLTREELAEMAGVHPGTIKNYEVGDRSYSRIPKALTQIEAAIGWTPGSAAVVLDGGQAAVAPANADPETPHYRHEPLSESDLVALIRNTVYESFVVTQAEVSGEQLREIEERSLRFARQVGYGPRLRRQGTHIEDDPEP